LQYYVLAGTGSVNAISANQQRSTFSPNATLNGSIIVTAGRNGAPSCTHFSAYVDLTTGDLMAEARSHILPHPPLYNPKSPDSNVETLGVILDLLPFLRSLPNV
jgi:hypothetical protein